MDILIFFEFASVFSKTMCLTMDFVIIDSTQILQAVYQPALSKIKGFLKKISIQFQSEDDFSKNFNGIPGKTVRIPGKMFRSRNIFFVEKN